MVNNHINELENSSFSPDSFVSKTLSQAPKDNTKNKVGCQTVVFKKAPVIVGNYSTVGRKEGEGPLGEHFQYVIQKDLTRQQSGITSLTTRKRRIFSLNSTSGLMQAKKINVISTTQSTVLRNQSHLQNSRKILKKS